MAVATAPRSGRNQALRWVGALLGGGLGLAAVAYGAVHAENWAVLAGALIAVDAVLIADIGAWRHTLPVFRHPNASMSEMPWVLLVVLTGWAVWQALLVSPAPRLVADACRSWHLRC